MPKNTSLFLPVLFFMVSLGLQAKLTCDNFTPNEEIHYSMPLLKGECPKDTPVTIVNKTTGEEGDATWHDGRYKALVDLHYGVNEVELKCGEETLAVPIVFTKLDSENMVKFFYVVGKDDTSDFYIPPGYEGENTNYWDRIDRAAKIMQTFSAHDLDENPLHYGKKTFQLELDDNYHVVVHVVTSKYTRAEIQSYRKANGTYDNYKFHAKLREAAGHDERSYSSKTQYVAIGNFSELKDGLCVGHTATGGGSFGAFGSGAVYTWPRNIKEVIPCFLDNTVMDPKVEIDDSCHRHRRWAHLATTLGATIHENGHALGLPHFYGKYVIMSRGHDQLNRIFTFYDPPTDRVPYTNYFEASEVGRWSDSAAAFLNEHPFFNPNRPADGKGPVIREGRQNSTIVIEDESGIVWYAYKDSDAYHFSDTVCFEKPYPKKVSITRLPSDDKQSGALHIIASNGNGYASRVDRDYPYPVRTSYVSAFTPEKGYKEGVQPQGMIKGLKDPNPPIVRSESEAVFEKAQNGDLFDDEQEFQLKVRGDGNGVKIPVSVGKEAKGEIESLISVSCEVKPVQGGTIIDLKDVEGVSFFYLEYMEDGSLVIHTSDKDGKAVSKKFKSDAGSAWQNVKFTLDLKDRVISAFTINGTDILGSEIVPLGTAANTVASVWLKNKDAKNYATFRSLRLNVEPKTK
ncbi:hypothetical protein J6X96_00890 [bacterium]|nr:hypothetical protein [bacterium]